MPGQTGPAWFILQGQHGSVWFWPGTVWFKPALVLIGTISNVFVCETKIQGSGTQRYFLSVSFFDKFLCPSKIFSCTICTQNGI